MTARAVAQWHISSAKSVCDDLGVRTYLSSFRLGTEPEHLLRLAGAGARTGVIANAIDGEPDGVRLERATAELAALSGLGLEPFEIDLRAYFSGRTDELSDLLRGCDALWVRGGNVFVLRHALAASHADQIVIDLVNSDAVVYAGYSAGPCVLGPTLAGLETVDDPQAVSHVYGAQPTWPGLGVVEFRVVPHVQSPTHVASAALDEVAEEYRRQSVPHITLRDGEAFVIEGEDRTVVGSPATIAELMY